LQTIAAQVRGTTHESEVARIATPVLQLNYAEALNTLKELQNRLLRR